MTHRIVTCPEWGAAPPKQGIQTCGQAKRVIFHHTAGHHREIALPANESYEEARRYALDIQAAHQAQGWNDSGQNFTVFRNGLIFQGRWLTVSAIEARHMVISAHCPGQNDQIGIEHEHLGSEPMTELQRMASAWLQAWIAKQYGLSSPLLAVPHRQYFATACPANLVRDIPVIVHQARILLQSGQV